MTSGSFRRKVLCLLLLLAAPGSGWGEGGTREVMANAMAKMMEAMGLLDSAPADPSSHRGRLGGSDWSSGSGFPWRNDAQGRSPASPMEEMMRRFGKRMYPPGMDGGDWPPGWKPSLLEGVWEGRDGELLVVQGDRFRIYSALMQRVDGLVHIQGNRLALYNPLDQHAQAFEFAESQGRLVMRDVEGQVYLYRRLRLDGGHGRAAIQTLPDR
jgi:hypothetical protein